MGSRVALDGTVAVITGAGRNIGEEIARRFAREGATVIAVDIDRGSVEETVACIHDFGSEATAFGVDITDEGDVGEMVATVEDRYGSIDVLVNNAAVTDRTTLLDLEVEEFDRVCRVNLRGTFICTREVARSMRNGGGGSIINLASTSAHRGRIDAVAYATTKSAILNFTRSAAKALAADDIRVNSLTPTSSGTRTLPVTPGIEPDVAASLSPERVERTRSEIPVGRMGTPRDQANAAVYLASPESEFVTGIELIVDGGRIS